MTAALAPGERWTLGYRPALDGLRGVAVLLVMAYHFFVPGFLGGGHTGVTIFFVLSGFLITTLLIEESRRTDRIDIAAFYLRRARRLLPALFFVIAIVVLLAAVRGRLDEVGPNAVAVSLYFANWAQLHDPISLEHLSHTWSLAVEEQFYLVWPVTVIAAASIGGLRALVVVSSAIGLAAFGMRMAGLNLAEVERVDALMIGCLVALAISSGRVRIPSSLSYVAAAALLLATLLPLTWPHIDSWGLLMIALMTAVLITNIVAPPPTSRLTRALEWEPIARVGRISYGLYLWHFVVGWELWPALNAAEWHWLPAAVVMTGASAILALASYRYVELPFMRRRASLSGIIGVGGAPPPSVFRAR